MSKPQLIENTDGRRMRTERSRQAIIEATLNDTQHRDPKNIEEVLSADSEARRLAMEKLRD